MIGADLHGMLPEMLPRLWAFAFRISGDRHDAEDLVQRACVRALERSYQLQPDTSPLSWMFSIVHSIWIHAAEVLDVPIGTIMSRLARARQAIGALLRRQGSILRASNVEGALASIRLGSPPGLAKTTNVEPYTIALFFRSTE